MINPAFIHDTVKKILITSPHQQNQTLGKHSLLPSKYYRKFPRHGSKI